MEVIIFLIGLASGSIIASIMWYLRNDSEYNRGAIKGMEQALEIIYRKNRSKVGTDKDEEDLKEGEE